MKTKHLIIVAAHVAALLSAPTVACAQNPGNGFDGRPIDLTVVSSPSPLVRCVQTLNVAAHGKVQVTCHASYAPGETTEPELVQYFALFRATQPDATGGTSLEIVAYMKVDPGTTYEFSPTVPTKVVIFGGVKPFLNRPLDNDRLPQLPPIESKPEPKPAPKADPKRSPKASGGPAQVT